MAKNEKIKCFYPELSGEKPNVVNKRHYIHSEESYGYWATVRDLTQDERVTNGAVGEQTVTNITVGYNPKILEKWKELIIVDQRGVSYRLKTKPDEFFYDNYGLRSDMRLVAYAFTDRTSYAEGNIYE